MLGAVPTTQRGHNISGKSSLIFLQKCLWRFFCAQALTILQKQKCHLIHFTVKGRFPGINSLHHETYSILDSMTSFLIWTNTNKWLQCFCVADLGRRYSLRWIEIPRNEKCGTAILASSRVLGVHSVGYREISIGWEYFTWKKLFFLWWNLGWPHCQWWNKLGRPGAQVFPWPSSSKSKSPYKKWTWGWVKKLDTQFKQTQDDWYAKGSKGRMDQNGMEGFTI